MSVYKLRWLSLAAPLGLLGILLQQPLLYVLFGFSVFAALFWVDERAEANLGRAAAFTYVVTLIAFAAWFVFLAILMQNRDVAGIGRDDLVGIQALASGAIYGLHLLSFTISYAYFEAKGR